MTLITVKQTSTTKLISTALICMFSASGIAYADITSFSDSTLAPVRIRECAAEILASPSPNDTQRIQIGQLIKSLSDETQRDFAAAELVRIGSEAIAELLTTALSARRVDVRLEAVRILANILHPRSVRALETISQTSSGRSVKLAAAEFLRQLKPAVIIADIAKGKEDKAGVGEYSRLIITDIHGDYETFRAIRGAYNRVYPEGRLICLGDYMRKGLESIRGTEAIFGRDGLVEKGEAVAILGNHEIQFLAVMLEKDITEARKALHRWLVSIEPDLLGKLRINPNMPFDRLFNSIRNNRRLRRLAKNMFKNGSIFHIENETLFVHCSLPIDVRENWMPYEDSKGDYHLGPASLEAMQQDLNSGNFNYGRYFNSTNMPFRAIRLAQIDEEKLDALLIELSEYYKVGVRRVVYGHFQDKDVRVERGNKLVGIDVRGEHVALIYTEKGVHAYFYERGASWEIDKPTDLKAEKRKPALSEMEEIGIARLRKIMLIKNVREKGKAFSNFLKRLSSAQAREDLESLTELEAMLVAGERICPEQYSEMVEEIVRGQVLGYIRANLYFEKHRADFPSGAESIEAPIASLSEDEIQSTRRLSACP